MREVPLYVSATACHNIGSSDDEAMHEATWKREFKLPWREAGPPNHHDDKVVSDQ